MGLNWHSIQSAAEKAIGTTVAPCSVAGRSPSMNDYRYVCDSPLAAGCFSVAVVFVAAAIITARFGVSRLAGRSVSALLSAQQ